MTTIFSGSCKQYRPPSGPPYFEIEIENFWTAVNYCDNPSEH